MRVGTILLHFHLPVSRSLKEKRAAIRPFVERLRRQNVSVAEVADQDLWQSAVIAVAAVASDEQGVRHVLEEVRLSAEESRTMDLLDETIEVF